MASGNNSNNDDNNGHPPGNQLSDISSQEVDKVVNEIVNNIRLSQDLFEPSTPTWANGGNSSSTTKKKTIKKTTKKQAGLLPKQPKPAKQNIFGGAKPTDNNSDSEEELDRNAQNKIAAAIHNNARGHAGSGQGSSSTTSSSSLPLEEATPPQTTESSSTESSITNNTPPAEVETNNNAIQLLLKQLLNLTPEDSLGSRLEIELREFYLKQMRMRNRAARQLRNIQYAKDRSGRVPTGMQIKVTPEVPGSEQVSFQAEWARALASAEEVLSNSISQHLRNFIEQIDISIVKIRQILEKND